MNGVEQPWALTHTALHILVFRLLSIPISIQYHSDHSGIDKTKSKDISDKQDDKNISETDSKMEKEKARGEKFIIRYHPIKTPSSIDVMTGFYKKADVQLNREEAPIDLIVHARNPYKLKVEYIPTSLPKDELDEEEKKLSSTKTTKKDNMSVGDGKSSIGRREGSQHGSVSKRSIKTAKSSKKKKKRFDIRSKASSGQGKSKANASSAQISGSNAQLTIKEGTESKSLGDSGTSKKDNNEVKKEEEVIIPVIDQIRNNINEENKGTKNKYKWSEQEVLMRDEPYIGVYQTGYLNQVRVWNYGLDGKISKTRFFLKGIAVSGIMENSMNLLVLINTVLLGLDRYGQSESEKNLLSNINIVITAVFIGELVLKLAGMGLVKYFSDSMNYLDFAVVIFSLVEIIFLNGQGALSSFRTLRIFRVIRLIRTFRVLRVARLLRTLRSMQTIIEVIGKTIGSFAYIGLLLLIFILIYALFGMQLYGGRFNFPDGTPRQNFNSFNKAFLSIFQILTMENWQDLLYSSMRAQNSALSAIYMISWIFIGNYVLLNLFLAIMLDAFSEVDEQITKETGDNGVKSTVIFRKILKTKMK